MEYSIGGIDSGRRNDSSNYLYIIYMIERDLENGIDNEGLGRLRNPNVHTNASLDS